jgi:hypothetical protein
MILENNNRVIVVLGMHRSGTSALTRSLQEMGVDLGDDFIQPQPMVNKKGFFEDVEINKLNVDLLIALNRDWHDLTFLPAFAFDQDNIAPLKLRAIDLLRQKKNDKPFGLKDPRINRLLPFWQAVFKHLNLIPSYVIATRHPTSVMRSLKVRDGFDDEKSYYLWLEHVLPAILETEGSKRVVVDFDLLLANPHAQLQRVAKSLDLPFEINSIGVRKYISDFLDKELRHSQFKLEDLHVVPNVPVGVIDTFELVNQLARDEVDINAPVIKQTFEQVRNQLQTLSPAFNYMTRADKLFIEFNNHNNSLSQTLAVRDEQVLSLSNETIRLRERVLQLDAELASEQSRIMKILSSNSWRLTMPLRELARFARSPKQQLSRYATIIKSKLAKKF